MLFQLFLFPQERRRCCLNHDLSIKPIANVMCTNPTGLPLNRIIDVIVLPPFTRERGGRRVRDCYAGASE